MEVVEVEKEGLLELNWGEEDEVEASQRSWSRASKVTSIRR